MAVCTWCKQEMTTGASCTLDAIHQRGTARPLLPATERCGDCGVSAGLLHHLGCDQQRCPCCWRQLVACGCPFDEEGLGCGHSDDDYLDDDDLDDDDLDDESDVIDDAALAAAMRAIEERFRR